MGELLRTGEGVGELLRTGEGVGELLRTAEGGSGGIITNRKEFYRK